MVWRISDLTVWPRTECVEALMEEEVVLLEHDLLAAIHKCFVLRNWAPYFSTIVLPLPLYTIPTAPSSDEIVSNKLPFAVRLPNERFVEHGTERYCVNFDQYFPSVLQHRVTIVHAISRRSFQGNLASDPVFHEIGDVRHER
jgi:hypothetical protein